MHILSVTTVCSAQWGFIFLAMCASKYKTHRSPVAWKSLCSNHWLERIFLTSTETTKIFSKTVNTFTKAVKTFIKAVKTFIKAVNAFNHAATALSTASKTLTLLDLHIPHLSLTPLYDFEWSEVCTVVSSAMITMSPVPLSAAYQEWDQLTAAARPGPGLRLRRCAGEEGGSSYRRSALPVCVLYSLFTTS